MSYLVAIAAESGLPLFVRADEGSKSLPFSTIGSLNGVYTFAEGRGARFESTIASGSWQIVWRTYRDSITFVLIDEKRMRRRANVDELLATIFDALVLLVGVPSLIGRDGGGAPTRDDRLKRQLRTCFPLVDSLWKPPRLLIGSLTGIVDVTWTTEAATFQDHVDEFAARLDTNYACLCVDGKVCVATASWWQLDRRELVLLLFLVRTLTGSSVPVFLPVESPDVAHRLVVYRLADGAALLCALCDLNASLDHVERDVVSQCWTSSALDVLKRLTASPSSPKCRGLPSEISLDPGIMAYIYVTRCPPMCMSDFNLDSSSSSSSGRTWQEEILDFYWTVAGEAFPSLTTTTMGDDGDEERHGRWLTHPCSETYVCTEHYKCYALYESHERKQLYLLLSADVPTYALRDVTYRTFKVFGQSADVVANTGK
ncbi:protein fuzzy homolog [Oscarella lobularis]|uniref:protein fuzzy homolog n=1 Tax=Oscarella lobularis TaxID=121494 RepID=UPI003313ED1C